MQLTQTLTNEYRQLWRSCAVRPTRVATADAIVDRIVKNKQRCRAAGKPHGVPWHVVGLIHVLESSGSFATHLHNGDPLTARTVRVPKGRPKRGQPPFTWEESASDALVFDGLHRWKDWSLPGTLFVLERFNGFGYRNKGIHSPYLWSFSKHYTKGKFVADGVFSATAVSNQCGAAVLLFRMVTRGLTKVTGATPNRNARQSTHDRILRMGAKGPAVRKLKAQLKKWFDVTSPGEWATLKVANNDVFGAQLKKAVETFQSRAGLLVDGEVGKDTREAMKVNR